MLRILLPIDALVLNTPAVDFACYVATLTGSRLTGMVLENVMYEERSIKRLAKNLPHFEESEVSGISDFTLTKKIVEENKKGISTVCENRGVQLHLDICRMQPLDEVIHKSRFADLLILNPDLSFKEHREIVPASFASSVLHKSQCAVIITPESFDGIKDITFCYDGSASSMFAIRQFTYLLPELSHLTLRIVQSSKEKDHYIAERHSLNSWLKEHYEKIEFVCLKGDPEIELSSHLLATKSSLVVMGAYSRTGISGLLHPSRADLILKATNLPVFFAHV